jgi:hypothetical protein
LKTLGDIVAAFSLQISGDSHLLGTGDPSFLNPDFAKVKPSIS